jgi:predicted nucleic acid-binding protein
VGLILDTSFVVVAEREGRRGVAGAADAFLAARGQETFAITFTVAGELACGRSASDLRDWQRLCRPYPVLPWTMDVAWQYGEIYRQLQSAGTLIGTNDTWIAATALVHGMGVVTRNIGEFQRVAGLAVVAF